MTLPLFALVCACPACLFTGGVLALVWLLIVREDLERAKRN